MHSCIKMPFTSPKVGESEVWRLRTPLTIFINLKCFSKINKNKCSYLKWVLLPGCFQATLSVPVDMTKPKPDLRSMAEQLARLLEVSVTLNSTLNQDELLQFIIRTATEILDCESVSILLYDEKRDRLIFAAATGSDQTRLVDAMTNMDMLRSSEMIMHRSVLPVQKVLLAAYYDVKNLAKAKNQQIVLDLKENPSRSSAIWKS